MNILKKARQGKYTQTELAEKLGITRQTYAKWERGDVDEIKFSRIKELSNLLELSPIAVLQEMKGYKDMIECNDGPAVFDVEDYFIKAMMRQGHTEEEADILYGAYEETEHVNIVAMHEYQTELQEMMEVLKHG